MTHLETSKNIEIEHHRLTVGEIRNIKNLSEEIMFNLSNEEFENMMEDMDPSICLEPIYFATTISDLEPQSLFY